MKTKSLIICLLSLFMLSGCAAMLVPETNNPEEKLNWAYELCYNQARPLPAEKLIFEAMAIYQKQNNSLGLGHAHSHYGDLLLSSSIIKWQKVYIENGFQDKSVTFGNRIAKSKEYFTKALDYYQSAEKQFIESDQFDKLTNVYFNMAWAYYRLDDRNNSCRFYDKSLAAYNENIRRNPTAKPQVSSGYGSPADQIASEKKRAGCE